MKLRAAVILDKKPSLSSTILDMRFLCSRAFSRSTFMVLIYENKRPHLTPQRGAVGVQLLWTYPVLLLELPELHVFDALLLVGLLDEGDLLQALRPLKVVDLQRNDREKATRGVYR